MNVKPERDKDIRVLQSAAEAGDAHLCSKFANYTSIQPKSKPHLIPPGYSVSLLKKSRFQKSAQILFPVEERSGYKGSKLYLENSIIIN